MDNKPTPEQSNKKECGDSKGCGCFGGKCCYVATALGLIVILLIGGVLGYLLGRCGGRSCGPRGMAAHKMCCDKPGPRAMGMGAECPVMGNAAGAPAAETSDKK